MDRKSWFYGLLAVVVLACGCSEKTNKAQADKKIVNLERNIVKSQSNVVKLETSMGNIVIELNEQAAPVTVKNFLEYVTEGFYDGTIFHRVIPGFMIQGGGFDEALNRRETAETIPNESGNGLANLRGTIAMARTPDPHSAGTQFFINVVNNVNDDPTTANRDPRKDPAQGSWGYAVFGSVLDGMETVDLIADYETEPNGPGGAPLPIIPVIIENMTRVQPR